MGPLLVGWCLLGVGVAGANVGQILLQVLGGPFAPVSGGVSLQCRQHSDFYLQELANFTPWALNMYDASTHVPSGLVTGNIQQLGHYDQCLNVRVAHAFSGQLCRATMQFAAQQDLVSSMLAAAGVDNWTDNRSAPYVWALCVPSTCSAADVRSALQEALLLLEVETMVTPEDCHVAQDVELSGADIAILALMAVTALLLLLSTSYDVITGNKKGVNVLSSFSLYSNGKTLVGASQRVDTMACLHGLRFLSIVWIVLGHTFYMKSVSPQINHIAVRHFDRDVSKMLVMNGTVTTDTFFLLSGILLSYVFLRQRDKFNLASFYLHRYMRLTPPYAFVVFFYATLLYRLGSGPLWDRWVGMNRDFCVANWWTNLLYVNNYVNVSQMCMDQTWYLAVDMQLFWLSPLLLYPLAKWPRFGRGLLAVCTVAAVLIPFAITFAQHLTAVMLYTKDSLMVAEVFQNIYIRTYARAGPYLIGIALGCVLHNLKGKPWNIHKAWVLLGWVLSVTSCAAVVLGAIVFYDDAHEYNALESSVYAGTHRTVWALGVAWVAFACVQGYGGPVDALLSWKLFGPLSRLTYCTYLCHYIVLLYNAGSVRTPAHLTDFTIVHEFAGNLLLSLALAAVISLAFELPFMNLDKILMARLNKKPVHMKTDAVTRENDNMAFTNEENA